MFIAYMFIIFLWKDFYGKILVKRFEEFDIANWMVFPGSEKMKIKL